MKNFECHTLWIIEGISFGDSPNFWIICVLNKEYAASVAWAMMIIMGGDGWLINCCGSYLAWPWKKKSYLQRKLS